MTYCDPSVLAPYCTATYCKACTSMRYENESIRNKEVPFLANLDRKKCGCDGNDLDQFGKCPHDIK